MAKAQMMMPEDFLRKLSTLGDKTDEISEKVLEAGGEVVLAKVKSNLSAVIGSGTAFDSRSTGELERSLGLSPVKVDKNGNHDIKIGFAEPRSDHRSGADPYYDAHKRTGFQSSADCGSGGSDDRISGDRTCHRPSYPHTDTGRSDHADLSDSH